MPEGLTAGFPDDLSSTASSWFLTIFSIGCRLEGINPNSGSSREQTCVSQF